MKITNNNISSVRFFRICIKYYRGDKLSAEESNDFGKFIYKSSLEDIIEPVAMFAAFITSPLKVLKRFYFGNPDNKL